MLMTKWQSALGPTTNVKPHRPAPPTCSPTDFDAKVAVSADFLSMELSEAWALDKEREMLVLELLAFTQQG